MAGSRRAVDALGNLGDAGLQGGDSRGGEVAQRRFEMAHDLRAQVGEDDAPAVVAAGVRPKARAAWD